MIGNGAEAGIVNDTSVETGIEIGNIAAVTNTVEVEAEHVIGNMMIAIENNGFLK